MPPFTASRRPVRSLFVKCGLAFGMATAAGVVSAVVAQSPARSRPADDELALRVKAALADHPTLRPHKLNLLVNVIDGVAVIGGAVPDAALGATIETIVAKVDGVARVKVSVWPLTAAQSDPLAARLDAKMSPKAPPAPVATLPALSVPAEFDPRPSATTTGRTPPNLLQPPVQSGERTSRAPHTRPPGAEPLEYTPIPATRLPTEPVLEPPPATPVRASAPQEADRDAWRRDPRFARLTVDVRSGTAVIGGQASAHSAAWELAEQVRTWPAVERVVVGRVEVVR